MSIVIHNGFILLLTVILVRFSRDAALRAIIQDSPVNADPSDSTIPLRMGEAQDGSDALPVVDGPHSASGDFGMRPFDIQNFHVSDF